MTSKTGFTPLILPVDTALSDGSSTSEKRGLTSKVASVFKCIQLYIQYVFHKINSALSFVERDQLFGKNRVMKTANCGSAKDIEKYVDLVSSQKFEQTAKKHKAQICNSRFKLEPFSGVCYGASLWFSRRYLETDGINVVAEEFKGSQPYEAVLLQSCYQQISADTMTAEFKAMSDLAGLASTECILENCSLSTILDNTPTWKTGVYQIGLPTYGNGGSVDGYHVVIFVKEGERNYLFDPSFGLGYEDASDSKLIRRLFTTYYGEFESTKGEGTAMHQVSSWSERIKNFLLEKPRLSSFGESHFTVERMALSPPL